MPMIHPLSGSTYDGHEDGTVTVFSKSGQSGRFTGDGQRLEGDVTADPQMCRWVASERVFQNFARRREQSDA